MLSEKGRYAAATQNRRTVWEKVVWPLILEINDVTFSVKQYQKKRDEVCHKNNFTISDVLGLWTSNQYMSFIEYSDKARFF